MSRSLPFATSCRLKLLRLLFSPIRRWHTAHASKSRPMRIFLNPPCPIRSYVTALPPRNKVTRRLPWEFCPHCTYPPSFRRSPMPKAIPTRTDISQLVPVGCHTKHSLRAYLLEWRQSRETDRLDCMGQLSSTSVTHMSTLKLGLRCLILLPVCRKWSWTSPVCLRLDMKYDAQPVPLAVHHKKRHSHGRLKASEGD